MRVFHGSPVGPWLGLVLGLWGTGKGKLGAIRGGFLEEGRFELRPGRSRGMVWEEENEQSPGF